MRDYIITSDSSCDLDRATREKYNIDYVNMTVIIEGKEFPASLDWEQFTAKEFYDMMRAGRRVKSTLINSETYLDFFRKHLVIGKDILYVGCSSALSGSVNSSYTARDILKEEYPDAKIICIDPLRASLALGQILIYAAKQKGDGKTIDEVASWIEEHKQNFHQVGSVEDLVYLKRAGRVTGSTALIGNILQIKPIIVSNVHGENMSVTKVRGRKLSIRKCIDMLKETIEDPEGQEIFIVHADCYNEMQNVKNILLEELKCKDVRIFMLGPVIGASTGPGMFGLYYYGKKVIDSFNYGNIKIKNK